VPPPTAQFAMRGKEKTSLCRQMATAIAMLRIQTVGLSGSSIALDSDVFD
jgi:hypothetical protein